MHQDWVWEPMYGDSFHLEQAYFSISHSRFLFLLPQVGVFSWIITNTYYFLVWGSSFCCLKRGFTGQVNIFHFLVQGSYFVASSGI
jgi:hypothetical protein